MFGFTLWGREQQFVSMLQRHVFPCQILFCSEKFITSFFFFFLSWAFFLRCLHTIGEKKMELNLKNEFKEIKQMKKETDKNYLGLGSADEIW